MFFSLAGSHVELRNTLFRALRTRVALYDRPARCTFYDGIPLPDDCKTPIAHQLRIWAHLDEWRSQYRDEAIDDGEMIIINGFGLDAAWHAARRTSCIVDRDHILQFQEKLVDLRIKAQGMIAPRYIVVAEDQSDPCIAYAHEYCARIPNQHEPIILNMSAYDSTHGAVDALEHLIDTHLHAA